MGRIVSFEDLNNQGISAEDLKKSLTLKYQSKTYRRRADLPKKFRDKAVILCEEIAREGKDSFVTETSFSYTVWEEEKSFVEEYKNTLIRETEENYITNSSPADYENTTVWETKEENITRQKAEMIEMMTTILENTTFGDSNINTKADNGSVKREYNLFQYTREKNYLPSLEDIQNRQDDTNAIISPEEVIKYRGVVVNQAEKPTTVATSPLQQTPKKTRVYRGVVY